MQVSACFLDELLVKSPRKLFIIIIENIFSGSKHPKNILFQFENRSTVAGALIRAYMTTNHITTVGLPFWGLLSKPSTAFRVFPSQLPTINQPSGIILIMSGTADFPANPKIELIGKRSENQMQLSIGGIARTLGVLNLPAGRHTVLLR